MAAIFRFSWAILPLVYASAVSDAPRTPPEIYLPLTTDASDTALAFTGTDRGLLRSVLGPWSPVPKCAVPGAPISVEEHTSMAPGPRCHSQNRSLKNSSAIQT